MLSFPRPHIITRLQVAGAPRATRAMTLTELLVAMAVASVFLVGVVTALSAVMNAAERARLANEANRNAASALTQISIDLAQAEVFTTVPPLLFNGGDATLGEGDRVDNDDDGVVDEEIWNGRDDDGDGSSGTASHVLVRDSANPSARLYERPLQFSIIEVSDPGVDEDNRFSADSLIFIVGTTEITYAISTLDDRENVLIRTERDLLAVPPTVTSQPIAFDVVSLNFLYFDPNWTTLSLGSPWQTSWDSTTTVGSIIYPLAVHVAISVYSGDIPLNELSPTAPIPTINEETTVLIEGVLNDYYATFP